MSQSPHSTDSQAVLQSMLQRLKLQSGREGQAHFQTPVSSSAAPALGQNGQRGAASLQGVPSSPVDVLSFNGYPSKEFPISATNSTSGFLRDEKHQASPALEGSRSPTFFPSQKVGPNGDSGKKWELGEAPGPGISPTSTRPLFPTKPQKEIKLTFFKRTDTESENIGSYLMREDVPAKTSAGLNMMENQNHVPAWSVNSTDAGLAGGGNIGSHVGNGGFSSLQQNNDLQVFSNSQVATNMRRKRSTENKTRRWTQKLKERFKDRHGNAEKKGKEDGLPGQETQVIMPDTPGNKPNNDPDAAFSPSDCTDSSKLHPAQTEDNTTASNIRRTSDFDIGLGSFSLLDEIANGQEWAKFLNPNLSTSSVIERPSEEPSSQPHIQPQPHSLNQSPGTLSQVGVGNNQWSFRSTESSAGPVFSMPRSAPVFPAANMDTSALKQPADQLEPMEDGQSRSEMLSKLQLRLSAFAEPSDNPYHSIARNRIQMSRKRQHQPAERKEERFQTEKMSDGGKTDKGPIPSPSPASIQMMEESVESQQRNISSSQEQRSLPVSLSPTSLSPSAPPPRGVLRNNMSHEAESAMETMTKRRRVEENRRVHFCEHVIAIESLDIMDDTVEEEEDLEADEDSLFEQDFEPVHAEIDEVLPARRSNLPAWIQALKRMNAGKKHR
ncbi:hypothetical protein CCH79_00012616, partial [Gambusia affinis]